MIVIIFLNYLCKYKDTKKSFYPPTPNPPPHQKMLKKASVFVLGKLSYKYSFDHQMTATIRELNMFRLLITL
jgi:hypothetical protein